MIGYTVPEIGRLLIRLIQRHAPDPRLCRCRRRGYRLA
jgi:hypothetical protein